MEKIYIATPIDYQNWGNRLQNYAVHKICEKLELEPITIEMAPTSKKQKFKNAIVRYTAKLPEHYSAKRYMFWRRVNCCRLTEHTIQKKVVNNYNEVKNLVPRDSFVGIGGDQILSQHWNKRLNYSLFPWVNPSNKICFSPSFGTDEIEDNYKVKIANQLRNIEFPAFREASGVKIFEDITGNSNAKNICDPVLMLTHDEWDAVIENGKHIQLPNRPYVIVYFLGKIDEQSWSKIQKYTSQNNLYLVDMRQGIKSIWNSAGPLDFVFLIRNADCVFTDSFHSTVFSIIYNRPICVFKRISRTNMNTRLIEVLKHFDMDHNLFDGEMIDPNVDYDKTNYIIQSDREVAWSYYRSIRYITEVEHMEKETPHIRKYAFLSVKNKSKDILKRSTSGGVFYALADKVISEGGVVYGVRVDREGHIFHSSIEKTEDITYFQGSKYVQSELTNTFSDVLNNLESGRKVLFSGTPCQVSGLKRYLNGRHTEKLITVDCICHGVPSELAWKAYLHSVHGDKKMSSVHFREKKPDWRNYSMSIRFEDGTAYNKDKKEDPWLSSFLWGVSLRPSCYQCKYKGSNRYSDVMIGDFWGEKSNDTEGTSIVQARTDKGVEILKSVMELIDFYEVDEEDAISRNSGYGHSAFRPVARNAFFKELNRKPDELFTNIDSILKMKKIKKIWYWANKKFEPKNYKGDCSGCTACEQICPRKAIVMKVDEEGFKYPQIDDEKCIHCDLCKKTCTSKMLK